MGELAVDSSGEASADVGWLGLGNNLEVAGRTSLRWTSGLGGRDARPDKEGAVLSAVGEVTAEEDAGWPLDFDSAIAEADTDEAGSKMNLMFAHAGWERTGFSLRDATRRDGRYSRRRLS